MNYYSHHIGDFDRATRHLTRIERSIYLDLLFVYYDTEQPLTLDIASLQRKIIARTNEEATAVEQVLNEFFTKTPGGWYHDRCEEELDAYRLSNSQKSAAGKASAAKRAIKREQALNGIPTDVEQSLNERGTARQLTNNQEPITNNHTEEHGADAPAGDDVPVVRKKVKSDKFDPRTELLALDVSEQQADDFLQLRKTKRAPLTLTALDSIQREAEKAGLSVASVLMLCCERGWQGFKAEWVTARGQDRRGNDRPDAYRVSHLDHSSTAKAMEKSMEKHGVEMPKLGDKVEF